MNYHNRNYKYGISKKLVLLLLILALSTLVIGGFLFYENRNTAKNTGEANPEGTEVINLDPPTENDRRAVEQHKEELASQQQVSNANSPAPGQKKQVYPVITSALKTEIRAYVPSIVEDGGTCTATATQGSQTVIKTSEGFGDASTTQCAPIIISLGSGTWSVIVTYSSSTAEGKSRAVELN